MSQTSRTLIAITRRLGRASFTMRSIWLAAPGHSSVQWAVAVLSLTTLGTGLVGAADGPRGTGSGPAPTAAGASVIKAKGAEVESPTSGFEQQEIRAQLAPHRYTTLAAEIGAKVSRLPIQEGGRFQAGQQLVSFDCSLQQAQLNKARAALSGAQTTWEGNKRLAELHSIGKVELDVSAAEVGKNQAEVSSMLTMLGKCSISAPFSGRVAEQKVREQQYVQPGQALMDIIDDSVLEIELLVPSKWLSWLKPGSKFQFNIDETHKSYPAKVQRIGARIDPVSQSIKLVAAIDGKYPELIAGMSGRVHLVAPP